MTKRKKRDKKVSKNSFNFLKILSFFLFALLISGVLSYYFYKIGFERGYERASAIAKNKIESIKKEEQKALQKHLKEHTYKTKDYKQNTQKIQKKEEKKEVISKEVVTKIEKSKSSKEKPKLAIIIDDVAFGYQVKALKSLGIKINPSFFPPSKRYPNTPKFAKEFKFYMVHLPLEATNFSSPESKTLLVSSSLNEIEERIKEIKKWFLDVKYINNHTGSAFTANEDAMRKLIYILKKFGLKFVDSRTTNKTVVEKIEKEFNERYLARDIFLDNKLDIKYIKNQLKKAIKIAKKRGYAIAIGHPHSKTFQALRESKDILKEVELVYIDKL